MHQPAESLPQYPSGASLPAGPEPPAPPQVRYAVRAMYAGAAATLVGVVIEIVTAGATKTAIERRSRHLTASQLNFTEHALIIGFVVSGLVAVAAWLILARACRRGRNWARLTGTALFALSTIDAIVGARASLAVAVRAWWPVIWLAGLIAVIFLWQRPATAYFSRQP